MAIDYPQRWLREQQAETSIVGWYKPITYEVLKVQRGLEATETKSIKLVLPDSVKIDETIDLNFVTLPRFNNSDLDYTLTISNESYCTFDTTTKTLKFKNKVGEVSITITAINGGATDTKTIKILRDSVGFEIIEGNTIIQGKQKNISIKLLPDDTTDVITSVYTDTNSLKVYKLSNGYALYGANTGTFNLYVKTNNNVYKKEIFILDADFVSIVENVSLNFNKDEFLLNEEIDVNPIFVPSYATETEYDIYIDDHTIATWNKTKQKIITQNKNGITSGRIVMRVGGASYDFTINVNDSSYSELEDIIINGMPSEFNVGESYPFTIEPVPSDVDISDYVITQSNDNIKIVDGVLYAEKVGETSITFTSEKHNFNKNTLIKINPAKVLIESFSVDIGDTISTKAIIWMDVEVFPKNAKPLYTISVEGNLECEYNVIMGGVGSNPVAGQGTVVITANDGSGVVFRKDINVIEVENTALMVGVSFNGEMLNNNTKYPLNITTYPENATKDIFIKVDGVLKLDDTKIYASEAGYGSVFVTDRLTGHSDSIKVKVFDAKAILQSIEINNVIETVSVGESFNIDFVTVPEFARIPYYTVSITPKDTLTANTKLHEITAIKYNNQNEMSLVNINIPSINYRKEFNVAVKEYSLTQPHSFKLQIPECLYTSNQIYKLEIEFYDRHGVVMIDNVDTRLNAVSALKSIWYQSSVTAVLENGRYYLYIGGSFAKKDKDAEFKFYLPNGFLYGANVPVYTSNEYFSDFNFNIELNSSSGQLRYKPGFFVLNQTHALWIVALPTDALKHYPVKITSTKKIDVKYSINGRPTLIPLELGEHEITVEIVGKTKKVKIECIDVNYIKEINLANKFTRYTNGQTIDLSYSVVPSDAFESDQLVISSPYLKHVEDFKYKIDTNNSEGFFFIENDYFIYNTTFYVQSEDYNTYIAPTLESSDGISYLVDSLKPIDFVIYISEWDGIPNVYIECDNDNLVFTKIDNYSYKYNVKKLNQPNNNFNLKIKRVGDDVVVKEYSGKIVDIDTPTKDISILYRDPFNRNLQIRFDNNIYTRSNENVSMYFYDIPFKGASQFKSISVSDNKASISTNYETGFGQIIGRNIIYRSLGEFKINITNGSGFTKEFNYECVPSVNMVSELYFDHPLNMPIANNIPIEVLSRTPSSPFDVVTSDIYINNNRNCSFNLNTMNEIKMSVFDNDNTGTYFYKIYSKYSGKVVGSMGGNIIPKKLSPHVKLYITYLYSGYDLPLNFYISNGSDLKIKNVYSKTGNIYFDTSKINDGIITYSTITNRYITYDTSEKIIFEREDGIIDTVDVKLLV